MGHTLLCANALYLCSMMQPDPKLPFIQLEHSKNQIHNDRAYMENIMHLKGPVFLLSKGITDYSYRICIAVQQAMCMCGGMHTFYNI